MALADDRETCRIDGSHLEQLVEISTPHRLAHVVTRGRSQRIPIGPRLPLSSPPAELAIGSQPLMPMRDDEPEIAIIEPNTATPIDQLAEQKAEQTTEQAEQTAQTTEQTAEQVDETPVAPASEEVAPVPLPVERHGRDAIVGGLIGLALLAASWLAMATF